MKNIFIICFLFLSLPITHAQEIDRSKAPVPQPAPTINIPDATTYTLPNGLKIIVVSNSKLPQVSVTLTIDGKPLTEGSKAGTAELAGQLLRRGTTSLSKEKLDEQIDFLGGSVNTSMYSISGNSLKKNFPALLTLVSDIALRPALNATELEKIKTQKLSELNMRKDNPDAISAAVRDALIYGKTHPYGEQESDSTVEKISVSDIRKFYNTWWKPNVAYLVFVGDIQPKEAYALALKNFGAWKKGSVPSFTIPSPPPIAKTYVALVDRPASAQSLIKLSAPITLKPGSENDIPAFLMSNILGGGFSSRLNQNLREKHGFTYGAGGGVRSDPYIGRFNAGASVRNEKTDSAVAEFLHELTRLRTELVGDEELASMKNYVSGEFARSLESPETIAGFALNIARYQLPKDYYRNYLKRLSQVTKQELMQMANQYIPQSNLVISIVGNAKEIAPGLEKYGEIKYFDRTGNSTSAPVIKAVTGSLSATEILSKAIEASGNQALATLKDLEIVGTASIMGQSLSYSQKAILPDQFSQTVKMGSMILMQQSKKGDQYSATQQGANNQIDEETKHELTAKAGVIEEKYYLAQGKYKLELKGIEVVDGSDAYKVMIGPPGGQEFFVFYDIKTGLKVQEAKSMEAGPMGKVVVNSYFQAYKNYEGLMLPSKVTIDLGPVKQTLEIKEVRINKGLKAVD